MIDTPATPSTRPAVERQPDGDTTEVIATFNHFDRTYELDHLGIGNPGQWGEFAIYLDGKMLGDFALPESILKPECRPNGDALPPVGQLIEMALDVLASFCGFCDHYADRHDYRDTSHRPHVPCTRCPGGLCDRTPRSAP